jgi:hypothetical protein
MLKFTHAVSDFNVRDSTWLVANLDCKRHIQDELIQESHFLPEDVCLRASEFWQKLLFTVSPRIQIISRPLMLALLKEWLEARPESWLKSRGVPAHLLAYVDFFMPAFLQSNGPELIHDWLKERPSARLRWGRWFQIAHEVFLWTKENNWILSNWTPAYLLPQIEKINWSRKLYVDLGGDLTALEASLILELAKKIEVTVITPNAHWLERYHAVLWPYRLLKGESLKSSLLKPVKALNKFSHIELKTYTTRLSEVKAAVSQVRLWLEDNILPQDITLFVTDVENYWPSLSQYFFLEGVPVNKPQVMVAQSLPGVGAWLSRLRLESGAIGTEDLESVLFSHDVRADLNYVQFRTLFANLMEANELSRFESILKKIKARYQASDHLKRDEFLAYALSVLNASISTEVLQTIVSRILLECPYDHSMQFATWISYLSALTARAEVIVSDASANGVQVLRLESGHRFQSTHVIMLGLTERALSDSSSVHVTLDDVMRLSEDLGIYMDRPESTKKEFMADWIAQSSVKKCILSHGVTDFSGQAEAPALFWLAHAAAHKLELGELSPIGLTLWDALQQSDMDTIINERPQLLKNAQSFKSALSTDFGETEIEPFAINYKPRLSAFALNNYFRCEFKLAASQLFHLEKINPLDLDLDSLRRGRLLHHALRLLIKDLAVKIPSDKEIDEILEKVKALEKIPQEGKFWQRIKVDAKATLKRFIEFEVNWRKSYPETKTVGMEVKIEGEWLDCKVTGSIDRIDQGKDQEYVVIDYKMSRLNEHTNSNNWLENGEFQLLFYIKALSEGWTELPKAQVKGAFYFFLKTMERDRGFALRGAKSSLYDAEGDLNYLVSEEGARTLIKEFDELVKKMVLNIGQGNFRPKPRKLDECKDCEWNTLCRAPHLNH